MRFEKPPGYDEQEYKLLLRNFEAGDQRVPLKIDMMPNCKINVNNNCAVSTDFNGRNYDYPNGDYTMRRKILAEHTPTSKAWCGRSQITPVSRRRFVTG